MCSYAVSQARPCKFQLSPIPRSVRCRARDATPRSGPAAAPMWLLAIAGTERGLGGDGHLIIGHASGAHCYDHVHKQLDHIFESRELQLHQLHPDTPIHRTMSEPRHSHDGFENNGQINMRKRRRTAVACKNCSARKSRVPFHSPVGPLGWMLTVHHSATAGSRSARPAPIRMLIASIRVRRELPSRAQQCTMPQPHAPSWLGADRWL